MTARAPTLLLVAFGVTAIGASAVAEDTPRIIWNTTASAPTGLYALHRGDSLVPGDWIAVRPTASLAHWLDARGYLPRGALLIKRVAAVAPSEVCRSALDVRVDGAMVARAKLRDRRGASLPDWQGCHRLALAELFLLNPAEGSLDSRYFGPVRRETVAGRVTRLRLIKDIRA